MLRGLLGVLQLLPELRYILWYTWHHHWSKWRYSTTVNFLPSPSWSLDTPPKHRLATKASFTCFPSCYIDDVSCVPTKKGKIHYSSLHVTLPMCPFSLFTKRPLQSFSPLKGVLRVTTHVWWRVAYRDLFPELSTLFLNTSQQKKKTFDTGGQQMYIRMWKKGKLEIFITSGFTRTLTIVSMQRYSIYTWKSTA